MSVEISVIIPVYRDWDRLRLCLEALERQTLPPGRFEIIVANNEEEDHTPPASLPANARIVHEPRPGSYAARNTAVAASAGRYLAFTDSDCVARPDWLANGLSALQANPHARISGPVSIFREPGSAYYAYIYDLHTAFPQREYVAAGHCVTANLLVARDIFDAVGPFDLCFSGGDTMWNWRAHEQGVPILYDAAVEVGHPARRDLADIFRKRRRTAGSSRLDVPVYAFVLERMKPPVRRLARLLRKGVGWKDSMAVFAIHWAGRLVEAQEFSFVRLGIKGPNRR